MWSGYGPGWQVQMHQQFMEHRMGPRPPMEGAGIGMHVHMQRTPNDSEGDRGNDERAPRHENRAPPRSDRMSNYVMGQGWEEHMHRTGGVPHPYYGSSYQDYERNFDYDKK